MGISSYLFLGALLLTAFVSIKGCGTTGKSKDDYSKQYRNASDECVRFGYRRDTPEFKECVEKRIGSGEESSSSELDKFSVKAFRLSNTLFYQKRVDKRKNA